MSTPDYATLARQFMDIWQQQMSRAVSDPHMVDAMMNAMRQGPSAYETSHSDRRDAHAPTASDEQLDELARRITTLEKRISELESDLASAAKPKARSKPAAKRKTIAKRAIKPSESKATTKRSTRAAGSTKKPAAKRTTKPATKPKAKSKKR